MGIDYIAQMLNEVLTQEQTTTVLLETMAGKGSEVGRTFEELRAILDRVELSGQDGCLPGYLSCMGRQAMTLLAIWTGYWTEFDRVIGLESSEGHSSERQSE